MTSLPHVSIEITISGPVRTAAGMRGLAWTMAGNVAFHASILAVASIIPVDSASWLLNAVPHYPPSGDNTVQLTAAFMDVTAASAKEQEAAPAVVMQSLPVSTEGSSEISPRKTDVSSLAALPSPLDAIAEGESAEEALPQSTAGSPGEKRPGFTKEQPSGP